MKDIANINLRNGTMEKKSIEENNVKHIKEITHNTDSIRNVILSDLC